MKNYRLIIIPLGVVIIDHLTKLLATMYLNEGIVGQVDIVGNYLRLHLLASEKGFPLLIQIPFWIAIVLYFRYLLKRKHNKLLVFSLALIVGGGAGNIISMALNEGYGIVFIYLDIWEGIVPDWSLVRGGEYLSFFPIFNFADLSITIGLLLYSIFSAIYISPQKKYRVGVNEFEAISHNKKFDSISSLINNTLTVGEDTKYSFVHTSYREGYELIILNVCIIILVFTSIPIIIPIAIGCFFKFKHLVSRVKIILGRWEDISDIAIIESKTKLYFFTGVIFSKRRKVYSYRQIIRIDVAKFKEDKRVDWMNWIPDSVSKFVDILSSLLENTYKELKKMLFNSAIQKVHKISVTHVRIRNSRADQLNIVDTLESPLAMHVASTTDHYDFLKLQGLESMYTGEFANYFLKV